MTRRSPSPSSASPTLRAHAGHRELQQLRRGRAAAVVDVAAVRRAADGHDLRAQVGEHARRHLVGGAVGAVDHDLQPGQVHARRAASRRRTPGSACASVSTRVARPRLREARVIGGCCELGLDALLELIGELAAAGVEELDAVVVVEIVRGADDDAEVAVEAPRHVGDAGRRQRPDQHHVHAGGDEARLERRLEHVARQARVLADEHRAALGRQHARRGARQLQREIHGHRVLADAAAHAIGAEILASQSHPLRLHSAADRLVSASTVAATSWARTMRAPFEHRHHRQRDAAVDAARRRPRPVSLPSIDLRDSPTSSGSPSAASSRSCRSSVEIVLQRLAEAEARVERDALARRCPAARQACDALAEECAAPRLTTSS